MLYIFCDNAVFTEIVQGLQECLELNGINSEITNTVSKNNLMDLYIIFGMNNFTSSIVPHNYIVYQLEQSNANNQSNWFVNKYIEYMKNAIEIWDYSLINYQNLKKYGIEKVKYVPLQYMSCDDHHWISKKKDIDVLFYGSMNQYRQSVIDQFKHSHLNLVIKTNIWSDERDDLISRSKIIINIHYYQPSILETARLSYLLSNNCVVVSEHSSDPILDRYYDTFVCFSDGNNMALKCQEVIDHYDMYQQRVSQFKNSHYNKVIPYDTIRNLSVLTEPHVGNDVGNCSHLSKPIVNSYDILQAEQEITSNNELILKLPKINDDDLPPVSIVTVTYNRKNLFPMAIRNWELFDYPKHLLEWVIVDDSDDGTRLSSILPTSNQIKYYFLTTTGRLTIGQKRNYGVEHSSNQIIVFMDDDDYYYPCSIRARVGLLKKYPNYGLVGVTDLDIYDTVNDFSARLNNPFISEASMAFYRSFWEEQKFPETFNSLGEGYMFTKNRRNRIVKMPSCFNLIAITHNHNYTQNNRSYSQHKQSKKGSLMSTLDYDTQSFIHNIFINSDKHT